MTALETCLLLARAEVEVRRRLEVQGLSLNELAVLARLADAPEQTLRRQDLADALGLTPSGITRLLAPLEKLGYVTRVADPRDARLALVVLTNAGGERTRDAVAQAEERATTLLDHALGADDQEALGALLGGLVPFT
jgi:DNA-binding MarR family transcriptional regulator